MPVTTIYTVSGMTCQHCVNSVTEEVSAVPGVTDVTVLLDTGVLTVISDSQLDKAHIAEAVSEAGYQLVD